jgi:hypothetical protein
MIVLGVIGGFTTQMRIGSLEITAALAVVAVLAGGGGRGRGGRGGGGC